MKRFLFTFGPGLLIAATGVGAGDLATSALAGSRVGLTVLTAIIIGGIFKYILNEGLARWQFCTGTTLIEGSMRYYGRPAQYFFFAYLLIWSFMVAVALMSASGIALHAILPIFEEATTGKIIFGALLSLLGVLLVRIGGYKVFERVMSLAILLMVVTVFITMFRMDLNLNAGDLLIPAGFIPDQHEVDWFVAVLGGVGGTVTILCYGYWIREHQREGRKGLKVSRVDLGLAYLITVLLGICMAFIGTRIEIAGGGANLLVQLADILEAESGLVAGWLFRLGAFAAIYSSLLGVWQSVPYLFTDLAGLMRNRSAIPEEVNTQSRWYKGCLYALGIIPMLGLPLNFAHMQKLYALCGAAFVPLLALTLILLHYQSPVVRRTYRNAPYLTLLYALIFLFFVGLVIKVILA